MIADKYTIEFNAIEAKHLELLRHWRNSKEVSEFLFDSEPISEAKQKSWYEQLLVDPTKKAFIMEKIETKAAIGFIQLLNIDYRNRSAEWGFYVGDLNARLDGSGAEAEFQIMQYAFNNLNLHKLWCRTLDFNKKTISMHKKFGFTEEGILRDAHFQNGEYHNVIVMSILAHEFWKIQNKWHIHFLNWSNRKD